MRFNKPTIVALLSIAVLCSTGRGGAHDVVLMGPLHAWHGSWSPRFSLETLESDERPSRPEGPSSRRGRRARFTQDRPTSRGLCSEGGVAR